MPIHTTYGEAEATPGQTTYWKPRRNATLVIPVGIGFTIAQTVDIYFKIVQKLQKVRYLLNEAQKKNGSAGIKR